MKNNRKDTEANLLKRAENEAAERGLPDAVRFYRTMSGFARLKKDKSMSKNPRTKGATNFFYSLD